MESGNVGEGRTAPRLGCGKPSSIAELRAGLIPLAGSFTVSDGGLAMTELPVLTTQRLRLFVAGPEIAERLAQFNRENADFLAPWEPRITAAAFDVAALRAARFKLRAETEARVIVSGASVSP